MVECQSLCLSHSLLCLDLWKASKAGFPYPPLVVKMQSDSTTDGGICGKLGGAHNSTQCGEIYGGRKMRKKRRTLRS
jgi:hypothetical protein